MTVYNPDRWVVVEFKTPKETLYKVLATWYGGYLDGDSWKLSSGIVSVKETDNTYEYLNHSGSIYNCNKNSYGMSGYTASVFSSFEKQNTDEIKISLVPEEDVKKMTIFVPEAK
jgi:hypothetical protein